MSKSKKEGALDVVSEEATKDYTGKIAIFTRDFSDVVIFGVNQSILGKYSAKQVLWNPAEIERLLSKDAPLKLYAEC
jgi:hypothetical protein